MAVWPMAIDMTTRNGVEADTMKLTYLWVKRLYKGVGTHVHPPALDRCGYRMCHVLLGYHRISANMIYPDHSISARITYMYVYDCVCIYV